MSSPDQPFPHLGPPEPTTPEPEDLIGFTLPEVVYFPRLITRPRDMTARHLAETVWAAHEAIGGATALAHWASRNRSHFYTKILARMLPQASSPLLQDQTEIRFRLAVPVKALDITDVEDLKNPTPEDHASEGG